MLIAGGQNTTATDTFASAEVYDTASGTWTEVGDLSTPRAYHTATLLPNGRVLVAGGQDFAVHEKASCELYDPATGTWQTTGSLATKRFVQRATLLPNGQVLVEGGEQFPAIFQSSAELYDPAAGTWTTTDSLLTARSSHTATLLLNGKVLIASGNGSEGGPLVSAELYDVGLGFSSDWQPQIEKTPLTLKSGKPLRLQGSRFKGISQASGGNNQDSSTNYPIVQLRNIDNSQVAFLPVDPVSGWSDTTFRSIPVRGLPLGPALVTVFTNGIPSEAKPVILTARQR